MHPQDVKDFVEQIEVCGLVYLQDGKPADIAVVDQLRGPIIECDWLLFDHLTSSEGNIAVAYLNGDDVPQRVAIPSGWTYAASLSQQHTFIPNHELNDKLSKASNKDGIATIEDESTGKKLYMGSTTLGEREKELRHIEEVVRRALELDVLGGRAKQRRDVKAGEAVYEELIQDLLPLSQSLTLRSQYCTGLAHYAFGVVLRVLKKQEEAVEQFRISLMHGPELLYTLLEMTRCLGELKEPKKAKPFALRAVEIDPDSPEAWGNLASVQIQLGEKLQASQSIAKALSLDPSNELNLRIKAIVDHQLLRDGDLLL
jgi:tetratricopeptide (TPR) repeat protein